MENQMPSEQWIEENYGEWLAQMAEDLGAEIEVIEDEELIKMAQKHFVQG